MPTPLGVNTTVTSIEENPLHADLGDFKRWGCTDPELPYDDDTVYDNRCRACLLHQRAAINTGLIGHLTLFGPNETTRRVSADEWLSTFWGHLVAVAH